jgi:hypothetical protein
MQCIDPDGFWHTEHRFDVVISEDMHKEISWRKTEQKKIELVTLLKRSNEDHGACIQILK